MLKFKKFESVKIEKSQESKLFNLNLLLVKIIRSLGNETIFY